MGIDVTLLPVESEMEGNKFAHTMLSLTRRNDLWANLRPLLRDELEEPLACYLEPKDELDGERGYGQIEEDYYGESLRWCYAKDLLGLTDHNSVQGNPKNRATWAYLSELDPNTRIVVMWR